MNPDIFLTPYTEIKSSQVVDLKLKTKIIGHNMVINLGIVEVGGTQKTITTKEKKNDKLILSKLKLLAHRRRH